VSKQTIYQHPRGSISLVVVTSLQCATQDNGVQTGVIINVVS